MTMAGMTSLSAQMRSVLSSRIPWYESCVNFRSACFGSQKSSDFESPAAPASSPRKVAAPAFNTSRRKLASSTQPSSATGSFILGNPHGNRLQFRMHRFKCAVAKPVEIQDGSENANNGSKEQSDNDDEEEDDYPLWMEEDDPTWPEGEDEGYGFQVSQFFEKWGDVKVKNVDEDGKEVEKENDSDDEDDDLSLKWEEEEDQWIVREINFLEWDLVALEDPTPLIVFGFERYGSSGSNCWALLKELETMLKRIVDSRKYPVRAVKFDVNIEPDLAAALKIKTIPTLLFIKAGKLVYRMTGVKSADDLLLITSHLFYHSTRPAFMDDDKTSDSLTNTR
ncbi:hypothetical protein R1flu_019644 [Riccia fluitans]|uniref:Thioredoxin domain-containing protein n=1 Tax=Riccia fluitans TaxID=41844 RepID=A0ABD1ZLE3_9MARC